MVEQMTVVAVQATGHVVGAVTGAAADQPSADQLAGDALPVRFRDVVAGVPTMVVLAVPADQLAVAGVPLNLAVFADPTDAFVVFPDTDGEDPTLELITSTGNGQLSPLAADTVQVTVPAATLADPTPFWVLFQGRSGQPPMVLTGQVPAGTNPSTGPVPHTLQSGTTYDALVLVAGLQPHVDANQSVP
jgi:hypothetical protein